MAGNGSLTIDGYPSIWPGRAVLVPRGSERSIAAESDRFAYLTVHRARGPLLPTARGPKSGGRGPETS